MKTSKYFSDKIVFFLAVCVVLSFVLQIFKLLALVNLLYMVSLLLVFFLYLRSGYFNKITLAITALIGVASIINGFRYDNLDYYTHVLITLCIFICIEISAYVQIERKTFVKIANLFLLTSAILLVAYYFGPLKTTYQAPEIGYYAITLNFPNPNAAGLWLTCIFIMLVYSSFLFKAFKKVLYLGVAIGLLPIILATESRNSFFACIFFVAGIIITKTLFIKKVPNAFLAILATLPLIVFVFYMFVIVNNMSFWEEIFAIESIDKGIGSRVGVWQIVIDDFWHCFLIGDYYKYYNSQMHNSLLTIFCRFGTFTTLLSCIAIYRSLKLIQENSSFFAALSLSAIFFTGCFEASIFVGIAGLYLMLLILPACASVENADTTDTDTDDTSNEYDTVKPTT